MKREEHIERLPEFIVLLDTAEKLQTTKGYLHKCLKHNIEWLAFPANLHRGKFCKQCGIESNRRRFALGSEKYQSKLSLIHPHIYLVGSYINVNVPTEHVCTSCGKNDWFPYPINLLNGQGCPGCKNKMKKISFRGNIIYVQGYEPYLLSMLEDTEYSVEVFSSGKVPITTYELNSITHRHFPDIFIESNNLLIEVKSMYTLGIGLPNGLNEFETIKRKIEGSRQMGYNYKLVVFKDKNTMLNLSTEQILQLSFKELKDVCACSNSFSPPSLGLVI